MPADKSENAVECGIKLSEWYSREVLINGVKKKCIAALLNPRDDNVKYTSPDYKCLKLEVQPKYCFVADSLLYGVGLEHPDVMEMYYKSIMPVGQYTFGTYRLPECLITETIISEHISELGKGLDSPVLFDNSQELYFNNLLESFKEEHKDFNDAVLYHFFKRLSLEGKVSEIEDEARRLAVFKDKRSGKVYTLKIPDMSSY